MNRSKHALIGLAAALALTVTGAAGASSVETPQPVPERKAPGTEQVSQRAALQTGPKHDRRPTVRVGGRSYAAANPYLALLPDQKPTDWSYWRSRTAVEGRQRALARRAQQRQVPTPLTYEELEPSGQSGSNDTRTSSERIADVGIGRPFQAARVLGRLANEPVDPALLRTGEDQGSIPRATRTRLGGNRPGVLVRSRIGDGPYGRSRRGTGDFDFFRVSAVRGETIGATTRGSRLDTVLAVYGPAGRILAVNDDSAGLTSALEYRAGRTGAYYVMVGGFGPGLGPANPFRSGSGRGAGDEGRYRLQVTRGVKDLDSYGVQLGSGDVLGGTLTGGASKVAVTRPDGARLMASEQDLSAAYPPSSPLPGGGATFAYVAEQPGWYTVSAQQGAGDYRLLLETYRPGTEQTAAGQVQTIFLDFDGERVNTRPFAGPFGRGGVSTLSPLSSFMARWGLSRADEPALVDAVVAVVEENIRQTVADNGLNPDVQVQVLDSRSDPDPWGQPNVSRVIVGGTIAQSAVPTIGIAQSIDPGNYDNEETALVLLDLVSQPAGPIFSFNTYLRPRSQRLAFVGQALGNVVAHETGHFVGSFHTDNVSRRANLMDSGGRFARLYGTGPDRVGGTPDDRDVNFGEDTYAPQEGLTGLEDTLNNTAWAFRPGSTP